MKIKRNEKILLLRVFDALSNPGVFMRKIGERVCFLKQINDNISCCDLILLLQTKAKHTEHIGRIICICRSILRHTMYIILLYITCIMTHLTLRKEQVSSSLFLMNASFLGNMVNFEIHKVLPGWKVCKNVYVVIAKKRKLLYVTGYCLCIVFETVSFEA